MPPIGGLKKTRITCFSVNTLAILASINRPLFCEESIAMAEPLTKPRFDPQIEVNKPITPAVGDGDGCPTSGVMGLFTSICGSNLGLVSGSAMAMDSSQNNGLFIDARMASVFTEKQVIRVFFSPSIGGIGIKGEPSLLFRIG